MPSLQELVNAIPVASRGDIITPESHNTLRAALAAVVNQLGAGTSSGVITSTFAPTFFPSSAIDPVWLVHAGFARSPIAAGSLQAAGWIPLQLPEGYAIQRLTVVAGRTGPLESPAQMDVMLQRQPVHGATSAITLARVSLVGSANAHDPLEVSANYAPTGLASSEFSRAQIIDTEEYKYFARAELLGGAGSSSVFIYAIRVESRPA